MNRNVKRAVGLGALIVAMALVAQARAAFVIDPTDPSHITGVLSDWQPAGTQVLQQDKIWTYTSSTLPATTPLNFDFNVLGGLDHHSLQVGQVRNTSSGATLDYTISIAPGNPGRLITAATLGVDPDGSGLLNGQWSVTKQLFNSETGGLIGTLTVNQSSVNPADVFFAGVTSIDVVETWRLDANSVLTSTTNTYLEGTVPEPASVAIWTLLAGVGIVVGLRRRHRAA
jgi:hypothetical protein